MDKITKEKRSWNMRQVHNKNTKPEIQVRSFLYKQGFRFRLQYKKLPGKPDIVLPKYKTAIEIRGCFWHHHKGCKEATVPATNVAFWHAKLERNMARDKNTEIELKRLGWNLIVVWECELKNKGFLASLPDKIINPGM